MHTWHLTLATDGRQPMFAGEHTLRLALRALARVLGDAAALFNIVDDHLHLVLWCDRARCGRLAQALLRALRPLASAPVEPARIRPVETRAHLRSLLDYVLSQSTHHGLGDHPALWTGSCFVDLIGARRLPGLHLMLHAALPRFRWRDVYAAAGLTRGPLAPCPLDAVRAAGITRLTHAAAAALAVGPTLHGRTAPVVEAKRAIAQLAQQAAMALEDVAWALDLTPRSVRRLHTPPVDQQTLDAVRLQLALEDAVRQPSA